MLRPPFFLECFYLINTPLRKVGNHLTFGFTGVHLIHIYNSIRRKKNILTAFHKFEAVNHPKGLITRMFQNIVLVFQGDRRVFLILG